MYCTVLQTYILSHFRLIQETHWCDPRFFLHQNACAYDKGVTLLHRITHFKLTSTQVQAHFIFKTSKLFCSSGDYIMWSAFHNEITTESSSITIYIEFYDMSYSIFTMQGYSSCPVFFQIMCVFWNKVQSNKIALSPCLRKEQHSEFHFTIAPNLLPRI